MIETLRTGSAPGVSIPTIACPPSWYAVRGPSEDRLPSGTIRRLDCNPAIEPPRPQECLVEHVGPVGRPDDDHVGHRVEPVHLGQDLVERLLSLVVAATEPGHSARARAPDGVELVDE